MFRFTAPLAIIALSLTLLTGGTAAAEPLEGEWEIVIHTPTRNHLTVGLSATRHGVEGSYVGQHRKNRSRFTGESFSSGGTTIVYLVQNDRDRYHSVYSGRLRGDTITGYWHDTSKARTQARFTMTRVHRRTRGHNHHDEDWHAPPPVTGHPQASPPPHGHAPPTQSWASSPDVIRACGAALFSSNTQRCLDTVRDYYRNPTGAIAACDAATVGDTNTLQCIAAAKSFYMDAGPAIAACKRALVGNDAVTECVSAASASHGDPVPAIRACADGSVGNGNTLSCIRGAFGR